MNRWGCHWANIDISDDEARRVASLGVSNVTLLHLQAGQLPLIRALFDGTILCRFYDKGFLSKSAAQYAERVAEEATKWMLYTHDWVPANEMNLEMESGPGYDDIQRVTDWTVAVAEQLRALCPWMRLHAPAYSPSGNWTEYIRRLAPYVKSGLFHVAGVHAYGSFDMMASVVKAHRVYYGADVPLFVSELNGPGTLDFFRWLEGQPNVLGGTYYIWRWANPDMPGWDRDLMGSPLEQDMSAAHKWLINMSGTEEDTMEEQIQMLLQQNALLTQALIAFRQGKFTGADGIDGIIVALTGKLLDFEPSYPPA